MTVSHLENSINVFAALSPWNFLPARPDGPFSTFGVDGFDTIFMFDVFWAIRYILICWLLCGYSGYPDETPIASGDSRGLFQGLQRAEM